MTRRRQTRQRAAIEAALAGSEHPLSPEQLLARAQRKVPGLGMATVYRAIRDMTTEGLLTAVELPGAPPRYELSGRGHHHHFECRQCDRVFEVPGCPGDLSALTPSGFALERHEVVLYGLCGECVPNGAAAR
jgi:Fur family ferric uptake transcriptional regulator